MAEVRSACPLNCPDSCAFLVEKSETGLKIRGDKENRVTRGFVCSKGKRLGERAFSPDRLRFPLLKKGEGFRRIGWDEAYSLLETELRAACTEAGSQSILHHFDFGHNGVLHNLDRRFFQALGGSTRPEGDMCWGAGYRAQEIDFGAVYANTWKDLLQAKTIVVWGRDPAVTAVHLMAQIMDAKKAGAQVVIINPVKVKSAGIADCFLQVNPGSDAALALGLAHIILDRRWLDLDFVQKYVQGFAEYARRAYEFAPERVSRITGVPEEQLKALADRIAHAGPVSILCGYGLQRYDGGGNTVRAIDALAAITGNIGRPGAGVNYAYKYHEGKVNSLLLPSERYQERTFPHALLGEALLKLEHPLRAAVVTRSNPLVQQPDSALWRQLWHTIPFKVVLDTYLSETAKRSDLVLPVTTIFEEEDLIMTSWNSLIHYAQKVIEPQGEAKPEVEIFTELAHRMGVEEDFPYTSTEWLEYVLEPMREKGVTLAALRRGALESPYIPEVAWADKKFLTPSGKIELFSPAALAEMGDGVANYLPAGMKQDAREYPWFLMTPHPDKALNAQFQEEGHTAFIHPTLAETCYLLPGDTALAETEAGQLVVRIQVSEDIHPRTVVIPEGTTADGKGVNELIRVGLSDCGKTTPYYDMRCSLRKWHID